jgi:hypothetical protein
LSILTLGVRSQRDSPAGNAATSKLKHTRTRELGSFHMVKKMLL